MGIDLQDLGAIGEFLGFLAVLATLGYLAAQIKESRITAGIAQVRELTADFRDILGDVSRNEELAHLLRMGINDWNSLSGVEQLRVHSVFANMLYMYLSALPMEHYPNGKSTVAMWEGNTLGMLISPGGSEWWKTMRPLYGNEPGIIRLDKRLSNPQTLPPSWDETMPWWNTSND